MMTGKACLECIVMILRQREMVMTPRGVEIVPDDIRSVLSEKHGNQIMRRLEIEGAGGNVGQAAQIRHMAIDLWWDIVQHAEGYGK